jgi:ribokinase
MTTLVTVVGSLNIDTVLTVDRHPAPGETAMGLEIVDRPGGKGANQALAASRTGVETLIIGRIGADGAGQEYRQALREKGVGVQHLLQTPGMPSGRAIVCVDHRAENNIVVIPGANTALSRDDVRTAEASIAASKAVLLQLETPNEAVEEALLLARKHSVLSILNASPVTPGAAALAELADVVIVNEHERAQLPGIQNPCVTLGAKGAIWHTYTSCPSPVSVVDTTGAGDAFAGTLAGYLALGSDPKEALDRAVAAGTEATTWAGAQPWNFISHAQRPQPSAD